MKYVRHSQTGHRVKAAASRNQSVDTSTRLLSYLNCALYVRRKKNDYNCNENWNIRHMNSIRDVIELCRLFCSADLYINP
ncbi:hypothetical protein V1478_012611 [Vespula squamosa]|uniref:Uncharacterized protein n=1 Tax=Vespula squamosa TaxID=30214 RepID=A0ABD2A8I2_VESSQ